MPWTAFFLGAAATLVGPRVLKRVVHSAVKGAMAVRNEVVKAIALPDINERLRGMAYEPMASTPAEFDVYFRAEVVKFTKIVADAKIAKQ